MDELRFDVVVNNYNIWCLRADTPEDRMNWVEILQIYKEESISTDTISLRRHDSAVSLQSNGISVASSGSSLKDTNHQRNLLDKINEIETFHDILIGQTELLQRSLLPFALIILIKSN